MNKSSNSWSRANPWWSPPADRASVTRNFWDRLRQEKPAQYALQMELQREQRMKNMEEEEKRLKLREARLSLRKIEDEPRQKALAQKRAEEEAARQSYPL